MLPADTENRHRDMVVHFQSDDKAERVLRNLARMNMSLVMSTQPVRDKCRIAFFCVSVEELASLRELIRETGGEIKSIETY